MYYQYTKLSSFCHQTIIVVVELVLSWEWGAVLQVPSDLIKDFLLQLKITKKILRVCVIH